MAKLNAVELDIEKARVKLEDVLSPEEMEEIKVLFEASELGLRSFRVLFAIRPLIASIFESLVSKLDAKRFSLEGMLRDIDNILCYWVVEDEKEERSISEK